jgi:hypothetical protein
LNGRQAVLSFDPRADVAHHFPDMETQQPFGAREGWQLRVVPDDLAFDGEVQQVALVEVDEQQAGARIARQVAQGVEEKIPHEFGRDQGALVVDAHESGPSAAVRDIDAARLAGRFIEVGAGDEEGVGAFDQRAVFQAQCPGAQDQCLRTRRRRALLALLDILRTIAEALHDGDAQGAAVRRLDQAIHAIAPARERRQPQAAQVAARQELSLQRIAGQHAAVDAQRALVRRRDEARIGGQHARPWLAGRIQRTDEEEGQLAEEAAVLVRHVVADAGGGAFHVHTHTLLDGKLAGVETWGVHGGSQ